MSHGFRESIERVEVAKKAEEERELMGRWEGRKVNGKKIALLLGATVSYTRD